MGLGCTRLASAVCFGVYLCKGIGQSAQADRGLYRWYKAVVPRGSLASYMR